MYIVEARANEWMNLLGALVMCAMCHKWVHPRFSIHYALSRTAYDAKVESPRKSGRSSSPRKAGDSGPGPAHAQQQQEAENADMTELD